MALPDPEFLEPDSRGHDGARPSPASRLIGASCGAFAFCFIAILISYLNIQWFVVKGATLFYGAALVMGAVGGFAFPSAGHFLGYGFLLFINLMLSLTIGNNLREQVLLFSIFLFIEMVFFLSRQAVFGSRQPPAV